MAALVKLGHEYPCKTEGTLVDFEETVAYPGDVIEFYLEQEHGAEITTQQAARAIFDIMKIKDTYPELVLHFIQIEPRTLTVQYSIAPPETQGISSSRISALGADPISIIKWVIIAMVVFAAIYGFILRATRGYLWSPPKPRGDIIVTARHTETFQGIPNVEISVDGESVGRTDGGSIKVEGLLQGPHTVSGEILDGFHNPKEKPVTVTQDEVTSIDINYRPSDIPEPTTGFIHVSTTPVRGVVFINGGEIGLAPVQVEVPIGDHMVAFGEVEGYITALPTPVLVEGDITEDIVGHYKKIEGTDWEKYVKWGLIGVGVIASARILVPMISEEIKKHKEG